MAGLVKKITTCCREKTDKSLSIKRTKIEIMHFCEKMILEKCYTKLDFLNFSVIKKIKVIDTKIKI